MTRKPTCLVADDHPALRLTVCAQLADRGYEIVGPAADGRAALALATAERPDVALIDLRMPHLSGLALIAALRREVPSMAICIYTADGDATLATAVLQEGAAALVLKASPLDDLDRALAVVLAGDSYVDAAIAQPTGLRGTLTARELDVLRLLADGHRHEEIGRRLGIGSETVRTHLRKACSRLGAATRTQAVATALRQGLFV
ncbi:MAG TPA: response regulator transcription factor [Gaiellaceae bacterium]|nr:response regulator transcription factor [Gaiellaceae bacterium]